MMTAEQLRHVANLVDTLNEALAEDDLSLYWANDGKLLIVDAQCNDLARIQYRNGETCQSGEDDALVVYPA